MSKGTLALALTLKAADSDRMLEIAVNETNELHFSASSSGEDDDFNEVFTVDKTEFLKLFNHMLNLKE